MARSKKLIIILILLIALAAAGILLYQNIPVKEEKTEGDEIMFTETERTWLKEEYGMTPEEIPEEYEAFWKEKYQLEHEPCPTEEEIQKLGEDFPEIERVLNEANALYLDLKETKGKHEAAIETASWLGEQEVVEEVKVINGRIWLRFKIGLEGTIE